MRRRRLAVAALGAPWVLWALVRTLGLDGAHPLVAAMAFTPYAAATALLPVVVALLAREWLLAGVAAAALAALGLAVAPRVLDGPRRAPDRAAGRTLVVMTANLLFGEADAGAIVRLARERRVDVLSLQEVTPDAVRRLDAAGARGLLPGRVLRAAPRASGMGLMARRPLRAAGLAPRVGTRALAATLALGGGRRLRIVAVHPFPPLSGASVRAWQSVLRGLPAPSAGGVPTVLAGDFNATLDQRAMRRLLDRGYTDAADATGDGLRATFPVGAARPLITIDHVLVPESIAVRRVTVHDVAGSDHRALVAELVLPGG